MPDDLAKYDNFWARFFGLEAEQIRTPGVNVVRHAHLGGYLGVWFFTRGATVVVSTPERWFDQLRSNADRITAEPLPSPSLLRELFGPDLDRTIGPVYQGYLLAEAFRPIQDDKVRRLEPSDEPELLALRSACAGEEWEHSGLASASEPRFGYFRSGQLVAAAGTDLWTSDAAGPAVLSHPQHRGNRYGSAVVSAVVEQALAAGKLPLYQTLLQYRRSTEIAKRLGYCQYATHMAVRTHAETL